MADRRRRRRRKRAAEGVRWRLGVSGREEGAVKRWKVKRWNGVPTNTIVDTILRLVQYTTN